MASRRLMLQGTGSDVGKSVLTAGLCRIFARRGVKVAPFKPQNMSNNAAVTADGGEIGRAQWLQAVAARVEPTVDMNPVLLKPESDTGAQIILHGKPVGTARATDFRTWRQTLLDGVMESFARLSSEADLVLIEGAGSASEVNLRPYDIANMGFALPTRTPVVLVGDINRGGVIAALVGTHTVLPEAERALVRGYIINLFRGDVSLFDDGLTFISRQTGWPSLGVVPFLKEARMLPAEDAVVLEQGVAGTPGRLLITVPLLSRIANFDDLDPLRAEPGVEVRFCPPGVPLPKDSDVIVLPGTKATIADLRFLKQQGWDIDIRAHARRGGRVLGICGGYQMLGRSVSDPDGIESLPGDHEDGLGLLNLHTVMAPEKTVRKTGCQAPGYRNLPVAGYEIHVGRTTGPGLDYPFLVRNEEILGCRSADGRIEGGYVHGMFDGGAFRQAWLAGLGADSGAEAFRDKVDQALDGFADQLEDHIDVDALWRISAAEP